MTKLLLVPTFLALVVVVFVGASGPPVEKNTAHATNTQEEVSDELGRIRKSCTVKSLEWWLDAKYLGKRALLTFAVNDRIRRFLRDTKQFSLTELESLPIAEFDGRPIVFRDAASAEINFTNNKTKKNGKRSARIVVALKANAAIPNAKWSDIKKRVEEFMEREEFSLEGLRKLAIDKTPEGKPLALADICEIEVKIRSNCATGAAERGRHEALP